MMPSVQSALTKLDRQIKKWYNKVRPHDGGDWRAPKCPICGATCKYSSDYMEHVMLEEHINCPNKHYGYQYVTGSTEVAIGSVIIYHYYADSSAERKHLSRMENLALIHERAEWRKKHETEEHEGSSGCSSEKAVSEDLDELW